MPLLLLFVVLPLIEIALFIQVGGAIGLGPTLAIVVVTAIGGSLLLRRQGARALADVQRALSEFRDPTAPLAHGALLLVAGVLLISPGLFTDALGLALLVPGVRSLVLARLGRRWRVAGAGVAPASRATPHRYGQGAVIDGDYVDESEVVPRPAPAGGGPRRPSGWTRGA